MKQSIFCFKEPNKDLDMLPWLTAISILISSDGSKGKEERYFRAKLARTGKGS